MPWSKVQLSLLCLLITLESTPPLLSQDNFPGDSGELGFFGVIRELLSTTCRNKTYECKFFFNPHWRLETKWQTSGGKI